MYHIMSKDGHRYIGSRTAKGCHPNELLKTYFTSSPQVLQLLEAKGYKYFSVVELLRFDNKKETIKQKRLRLIKHCDDPLLLNKMI